MFDVAWTEYLLIVVVALVFLGPKELPVVLRTLGRWVAKARQMAGNLERQLYSLEDSNQTSFPEKDKKTEGTLFTYQRVFLKQHKTTHGIFMGQISPAPKPWL